MPAPVACTIVANNYLAYARAFTRSFLDRHPEGRVEVLIADRPQPGHDYGDEPFAVTFVEELGIERFQHFAFRYSLLELSTAVKPYFLLHLNRTLGCERLCYFDPDILVLGDLSALYDRLGEADALLTPHLTAPLEDEALPSERQILLSGIYNLGFLGIAFNERTVAFLEWWARRLYRHCLHDVEHGLFVDQRWMDLAPAFLPRLEIVHDPGCNVAYWNLGHRRIARDGDTWQVDGRPLAFLHFSGYDPRRPELISKFQNRFTFADRPDVVPLFRLYGERIASEGQPDVEGIPYRYGLFDNGLPVPAAARQALRETDPEGLRWPNPFATGGPGSFFAWLRQPIEGAAGILLPRLAWLLWDQRPDLQTAFARPWGVDGPRFARWFARSAATAELRDPELDAELEAGLEEGEKRAAERERREGVMARLCSRLGAREPEALSLSREELDWLTADAAHEPRERPRVPRLALEMHRRRSDLRRAHPDPLGAGRLGMALWYATSGRREYQLPEPLVRPVLRTLPLRQRAWALAFWQRQAWRRDPGSHRQAAGLGPAERSAARRSPVPPGAVNLDGLNVVGWPGVPTGVGEACRGTLAALEHAGIASFVWPLEGPLPARIAGLDGEPPRQPLALAAGDRQALPYGISLFHVNADMMEPIQRQLPAAGWAAGHRIGYWFWELAHFPLGFAESFRFVDEVWAPSRFCLEAFRPLAPVPVYWVPPGVRPPQPRSVDRASLGIDPGAFLFFFAFDALSVPERKNPAGLLRAFSRVARESRRNVHLLLKVSHAEMEPESMARLEETARELPVTLLTRTLSRPELDGLLAACDAYVSLHRSEGLGLPLIEAMLLGKPVIACGYGGVADFLDEETGFVVHHRLVALARPSGPYPAGAVWAEPDVEHAATLMLELAHDPDRAAGRIGAARRRVQELYSPEAAGRRFRAEQQRLRATLSERPT